MAEHSSGLLFCRRKWEVDSDSGLPLSVKTVPVQIVCNKPNRGRGCKKLWICHPRSALGPIKFKLLICVVVNNTWSSEQIFLPSLYLLCHALGLSYKAGGGVGQDCACEIKLILALLQRSVYMARSTGFNTLILAPVRANITIDHGFTQPLSPSAVTFNSGPAAGARWIV